VAHRILPEKDGTQGDPIQGRRNVKDMQGVITTIDALKSQHGKNLRYVDVVIGLFKSM
jgi:hypothetical protein